MSNRNRAVPVLLPLFLLLGCADDHRVAGPDETLLPEVLASTSSGTEYEVVRLTYPFQYSLFGINYRKSDVASWINNGNSMNDDGWITGRVGSGAATWDPDGELKVLSIPEGRDLCHGAGINNTGHVVGSCWDAEWAWGSVPVFWDGASGTAHTLSMKVEGVQYFRGSARAISDDKRIAGFLHTEERELVAVVWSSHEADPVLLPELEPLPDGEIRSFALGMNSRGDIVGHSNNQAAAWFMDDNGGYTAIALPHGDYHLGLEATSINNDRDIVAAKLDVEPYSNDWWSLRAPWQPRVYGNPNSYLWLNEDAGSWLTMLPEDVDYQWLLDIGHRKNGSLHAVGVNKGGARPMLWTFDPATGKMLDETSLPYPAGWHRNNSWCEVRAMDPWGPMVGQCREVKGNDSGIWELIAWRPLGDPAEPPPPPPPSNDLEASFEYSCGNTDTCQFRCTSTGTVDSQSWTFANGNPATSTEEAPEVRFTRAGDHLVTLTVADADGGEASAEATVKCSSHPRHGVRCR